MYNFIFMNLFLVKFWKIFVDLFLETLKELLLVIEKFR